MTDNVEITHHIQKHILSVLMESEYARFRDMRPPKVDSNLYSYHLKLLMKSFLVEKTENGYTLGSKGLVYADRLSFDDLSPRVQPKLITMMVIQDGYGKILMYQKLRQPFIGLLTLPFGKVHASDRSISASLRRDVVEKFGDIDLDLAHAGDCYVRVSMNGEIVNSSLVHVFYAEVDESRLKLDDHWQWISPHKLTNYDLAPAVEKIVARTFFKDPYFFEEFEEELV